MDNIYWFTIAELTIKLIFKKDGLNGISLLPSFAPFAVNEPEGNVLFRLVVDDKLLPVAKEHRIHIRNIDTGNGNIVVDSLTDGGHQFVIKDIHGKSCCLLIANKDFSDCKCALNGNYIMRSFGLNNAAMMVYAFAGSKYQALLVHASLVRHNGYGYAFTAKSGTGKSTQVSMWLRYLPDCDLMNDDNPIIRIIDNQPFVYGSPWSGKTPCYRNIKAPLGAVTLINRGGKNRIEKQAPIAAFSTFMQACSCLKWDMDIYDDICKSMAGIIEKTPFYTLHCLPDKDAAVLCHKTITRA